MNIKPSASIRNNYNEISKLCKSTGEPVYLTKSGEGDLVVMDIEAFSRREKMLALRETLLDIERDRINGAKYYSVDEVDAELRRAIAEASGHGWAEVYGTDFGYGAAYDEGACIFPGGSEPAGSGKAEGIPDGRYTKPGTDAGAMSLFG